jgi:hypothetical protein
MRWGAWTQHSFEERVISLQTPPVVLPPSTGILMTKKIGQIAYDLI